MIHTHIVTPTLQKPTLRLQEVDVFSFSSLSDFLNAFYSLNKKSSRGRFTIQTWTRKLGNQSPRLISMVMKGQRPPSREFADKLSKFFALAGNRRRYFELLCWKAVKEHQKEDTSQTIAEMTLLLPNPSKHTHIDALQFAYIADWHHLVIKQLARLADFKEDPVWIARKLRGKITASEAAKSLQLLESMGYLTRDPESGKLKPTPGIKTASAVPSVAIRKHHEHMLKRATEAIEEVAIERRVFRSVTLRFAPSRIVEAQKMLEAFAAEFDARFSQTSASAENAPGDSDAEIYQLGLQLFPHT